MYTAGYDPLYTMYRAQNCPACIWLLSPLSKLSTFRWSLTLLPRNSELIWKD